MLMKRNLIPIGFFVSIIHFFGYSQVTIFTEDFQGGIPASWSIKNLDGMSPDPQVSEYTSAWISKVDLDSASNLIASSTSYFSPIGTADRWLISPAITLGAFGNFISWRARSHDASFPDNYLVLVSKTDTAIGSFTDTAGYIIGENASWTERTANLSEMNLDNETIFLAFVLQTENGFKLYVDDIKVRKDDPVGFIENQSNLFKIETLNPGLFRLNGEVEISESRIYNSTGQLVLSTVSNIIDIQDKEKGVYFLQVFSEKGMMNWKLIHF